jgi:hypothetical protein
MSESGNNDFLDNLIAQAPVVLYGGILSITGLLVSMQIRLSEISTQQEQLLVGLNDFKTRVDKLEERIRELEIKKQ